MTITMTLHHCKHCGQDKPPEQMRKDKAYPQGFRPQCLECKRKSESKPKSVSGKSTKMAKKPSRPKSKPKPKPIPAEDRVYPCNWCKRDDVPFHEMCKDKRQFMGVATSCLQCRRKREAELKEERRQRAAAEEKARRGRYGDEWEYCWKCNKKQRPGTLQQPPAAVRSAYPDDAMICATCASKSGERSNRVLAERKRAGLSANASQKEIQSAARMAAVKLLIERHKDEFWKLFDERMDALGLERKKSWISL